MKKLILLFIFSAFLSSCQESEAPSQVSTFTSAELESLLFTREEEKLAHDVYLYAYQKYGTPVFQNIANSESSHTLAVLNIMNKYGIDDPLKGSSMQGQFSNPVISQFYQDLTARVDSSFVSALEVGLFIEEMDIFDLDGALIETQKQDLIQVYESLRCGSTNHLRAFENLASSLGITYSPDFITVEEYTEIINSGSAKCGFN